MCQFCQAGHLHLRQGGMEDRGPPIRLAKNSVMNYLSFEMTARYGGICQNGHGFSFFFFPCFSSKLALWAKAYVWLGSSILASVTCVSSCSRVASEAEHPSLTHCPFFFPALDTTVDTEGHAVYVTGLSAHKWRSITRSLTGGSDRWNPKHLHTPGNDTDKHLHTEYQSLILEQERR